MAFQTLAEMEREQGPTTLHRRLYFSIEWAGVTRNIQILPTRRSEQSSSRDNPDAPFSGFSKTSKKITNK